MGAAAGMSSQGTPRIAWARTAKWALAPAGDSKAISSTSPIPIVLRAPSACSSSILCASAIRHGNNAARMSNRASTAPSNMPLCAPVRPSFYRKPASSCCSQTCCGGCLLSIRRSLPMTRWRITQASCGQMRSKCSRNSIICLHSSNAPHRGRPVPITWSSSLIMVKVKAQPSPNGMASRWGNWWNSSSHRAPCASRVLWIPMKAGIVSVPP